MKFINDVITNLMDPNIYISRLSFFESGRAAVNIKYEKSKHRHDNHLKFYTRSALVAQLIPNPSEGKVRALFGTRKITQQRNWNKAMSRSANQSVIHEEDERSNINH